MSGITDLPLNETDRVSVFSDTYSTEDQKQKDAQGLFDFCAECLNNFITDHFADDDGTVNLDEPLALGFTFSYPCLQEKIDHGILIRWTKGFGAPGAEGKDCAAMFQTSLDKFVSPFLLSRSFRIWL